MVTPEFIEASDPEEIAACGPGEIDDLAQRLEFYFRGYMEVPKCCDGGGCQQCQGGMRPGMLGPTEMLDPARGRTRRVSRRARQPGPRPGRQAPGRAADHRRQQAPAGPCGPQIRGGRRASKPALIGPVGYDSLK